MSFLDKLKFGTDSRRLARVAQTRGERRVLEPSAKTASYAAVAIRAPQRACKDAKRLAGRRFLVAEAPKLPLPTCSLHCTCTYKSYADRRQETRRAIDLGVSGQYYMGPERRAGRERRVDDGTSGRNYYDYVRETSAPSPVPRRVRSDGE